MEYVVSYIYGLCLNWSIVNACYSLGLFESSINFLVRNLTVLFVLVEPPKMWWNRLSMIHSPFFISYPVNKTRVKRLCDLHTHSHCTITNIKPAYPSTFPQKISQRHYYRQLSMEQSTYYAWLRLYSSTMVFICISPKYSYPPAKGHFSSLLQGGGVECWNESPSWIRESSRYGR